MIHEDIHEQYHCPIELLMAHVIPMLISQAFITCSMKSGRTRGRERHVRWLDHDVSTLPGLETPGTKSSLGARQFSPHGS